jgi:hypothetical protein
LVKEVRRYTACTGCRQCAVACRAPCRAWCANGIP